MPNLIPGPRGNSPSWRSVCGLWLRAIGCLLLTGCGGGTSGSRPAENGPAAIAGPTSSAELPVRRTFSARATPAFESADGILVDLWLNEPSLEPTVFVVKTETVDRVDTAADIVPTELRLTIAPGDTDASFMVPLLDDALFERDETVPLLITSTDPVDGPDLIELTIIDDDPLPKLTAGDLTVNEDTAASTTIEVPLTFDRVLAVPALIRYTLRGVSAEANVDFEQRSGEVLVPAGASALAIAVTVLPDAISEPAEHFFLHIDSVSNAVVEDAIGLITLANEQSLVEPAASFTLTSDPAAEGTPAEVQLQLSQPLEHPLWLEYTTLPGDATADDFVAQSGQISIPAGARSATIPIATHADSLIEASESFFFVLLATNAAAITNSSSVPVVIVDHAAAPRISVAGLTVSPTNPTQGTLTFDLSAPSVRPVRFIWSATNNELDVARGSGIFAPGDTEFSSSIELPGLSNATLPPDLAIQLIPIDGAERTITEARTRLTITDAPSDIEPPTAQPALPGSDYRPALSVTNANAPETAAALSFAVTVSEPTVVPISVSFATEDGTAHAGEDFHPTAGTLIIPAGATTATIAVPVMNDFAVESTETLMLSISNVIGADIGRAQALGIIVDDDSAPALTVNSTSSAESDATHGLATFELQLSSAAAETVTVRATTQALTATAGVDYVTTSGVVTFNPGVTTRTFSVPTIGDMLREAHEQFELILSEPTNATIAVAQAVATIVDNDPQPVLRLEERTVAESIDTVGLTVTLSAASGRPVQVDYETVDGTATSPDDFLATAGRLVFAPGETSQTIRVAITDDTAAEPSEFFAIRLGNASGADVDRASAQIEIMDTDSAAESVRLTWSPPATNTDGTVLSDLAAYRVYQGSSNDTLQPLTVVTAADDSVTTLVVSPVTAGAHCFAIAAVDLAGNEGPKTPTQCWSL